MSCLLIGGFCAGRLYDYIEGGKLPPCVSIVKDKKIRVPLINTETVEVIDVKEDIITYVAVPFIIEGTKIFMFKPDYMSDIDMIYELLNGYNPIEVK